MADSLMVLGTLLLLTTVALSGALRALLAGFALGVALLALGAFSAVIGPVVGS